jgi:hypothetical protein
LKEPQFKGTPFETRRCPRLKINRVSNYGFVTELLHHTGGVFGIEVLRLPSIIVDAAYMILDGKHWEAKNNAR